MKSAAMLLALVLIAGCKPTTIISGEPHDAIGATNATAALPPSISKSVAYSCDDDTFAFVDYLADGRSLNLRFDADETAIKRLIATKPDFYEGAGFSVAVKNGQLTLDKPGGRHARCKP